MIYNTAASSWVTPLARAGLTAKGIVYCLIGVLAFMAAFEIGGQGNEGADKQGALQFVQQTGGKLLLGVIAVGLVCYSLWRFIEAFYQKEGDTKKKWGNRLRYVFSGLVYLSVAVLAGKIVLNKEDNSGGSAQQSMASELLQQPLGQILVGVFAAILAGIGIYQLWYGLSGKYKKHVSELNIQSSAASTLVRSGKVGYIARGVVWLIIAWLMGKAALHANAAEAGDTSKAFQFLENASYGSYLLGALGAGLVCYGVFCLIRARYEVFE